MPAPTTISEFLELVQKSGVLDEKKLDAYVQKLRAANAVPNEPGKLAGLLVRDGLLTQFQAEQFMLGKWRRFTIGKYKVLEKLGHGGMGAVYLCEHKLMRRRVAVKVLPAAKAEDPSSLQRFYREARAVAALNHPNIVRAYDIDQDDKLHFLVMEYVDGSSLQEIIKKTGAMKVLRACHYIRQSAMGLQHAHEAANLVHRDIKPGNVLVDRSGTVKVLDMGLARFFNDDEDNLTKKYDENVLGTADYLAPEQALDSHTVDIRADIYSLGATFYFCLTGQTPFKEGTIAQKLIWHQTRKPKAIRSLRSDVPEALVAIIDRMMAKEPGQRYQTPLEVVEALGPWTQEPIEPPPEVEMPRLSPAATGGTPTMDGSQPAPRTAGGPGSSANRTWQVGPVSPSPKPRSNPPPGPIAQAPSSAAPTQPTRKPATTSAPPAPLPAPVRPAPAPRPAAAPAPQAARAAVANNGARAAAARAAAAPAPPPAAPEEESAPWEDLSPDTDGPTARTDPTPRSGSSRTRRAGKFGTITPAQRKTVLIVAAVVVGVLLLVAAGLAIAAHLGLFGRTTPSSSLGTQPGPVTLYVNRNGPAPAFKNLNAALAKVKPGDHIVIQDELIEDGLAGFDGKLYKGFSIEGEAGKTVVWRKPKARTATKFLLLSSVEGLRLSNLTLDGDGEVEDMLVLTGPCPGVTLEKVRLKGFTKNAARLMSCTGTAEQPVIFRDVQASAAKEVEAGLSFESAPGVPAENRFIQVVECKFEGPFKLALAGQGPALAGVTLQGKSTLTLPDQPPVDVTLPK